MSLRVWLTAVAVVVIIAAGAAGSAGAPTPLTPASQVPGGASSTAAQSSGLAPTLGGPTEPVPAIGDGALDAESPPGAHLAGGLSGERAALSGQFQADVYEVRLARAPSASARAAVLRSIRTALRDQLDEVLATRASLASNDSLPPGVLAARRSTADVKAAVAVRLAASARTAAEGLSVDLLPIDLVAVFGELLEDARAIEHDNSQAIVPDGDFDLSDFATAWEGIDLENGSRTATTDAGQLTLTVPDATATPITSPQPTPESTMTTPPLPEPTVTTPSLPEPTVTTPPLPVPTNETLTDPS